MSKLKENYCPFLLGMGMGLLVGTVGTCLLRPCHRRKTAPGRAMEEISGKVDHAVQRIHDLME